MKKTEKRDIYVVSVPRGHTIINGREGTRRLIRDAVERKLFVPFSSTRPGSKRVKVFTETAKETAARLRATLAAGRGTGVLIGYSGQATSRPQISVDLGSVGGVMSIRSWDVSEQNEALAWMTAEGVCLHTGAPLIDEREEFRPISKCVLASTHEVWKPYRPARGG